MKWRNLLWSVIILALIVLFLSWAFYPSHSKLGKSFNLFTIFMLFWAFTSFISPIIVLLRLLKVIKRLNSFAYIFLMVANFYLGGYGILKLFLSSVPKDFYLSFSLLLLNLVWGGFIFFDVFAENKVMQNK